MSSISIEQTNQSIILILKHTRQQMRTSTQEKQTGISMNFGLSMFESVIQSNFAWIQSTFNAQQAEISRISNLISALQGRKTQENVVIQGNEQVEATKVKESKEIETQKNIIMQKQTSFQPEESINNQQEKPPNTELKDLQLEKLNGETRPSISQQVTLPPPPSIEHNQTTLELSSVGVKLNSNEIVEEKIFELFERVRQLEQKEANNDRFSLKRYREFQFQIQQAVHYGEKALKSQEDFNETIDKLRNELSEYKLKKQSKIMKFLNSSSLNQTSTGENYDYMADKLQYLLKHVNELVTKRSFQEQKESLHFSIENLRKKVNENINETYFQETLKAQEARIYQSISKYLKAMHFTAEKGGAEKPDALDLIIQEGNREFSQKVNENQQKIKLVNEEIAIIRNQMEMNRKERMQFQEDCSEQMRLTQEKTEVNGVQLEQIKKYIQEMKQSFNQKHLQSQNQIIQLQDVLDKVSSSLKTYTFSAKESFIRTSNTPTSPHDNPQYQLNLDKSVSNIDLENDLKTQQKKFNKLHGKVQGLKEDVLNYREDLMREIEALKASLEKKADWESLKKGLNFFEDKLKETRAITQAIYQSTSTKDEGGDSLAVKKGWTCLVCDKDIKSYQGKLGEVKFTSMFPVRESPRIGGYYKQQQASQEYRQVFLSNSNLNNRSRRIGSLKQNTSKEELH